MTACKCGSLASRHSASSGALAIQDVSDEPHFVMLNSYLQESCEAEDIRRSVLEVAQWADDVEMMLTGRDDRENEFHDERFSWNVASELHRRLRTCRGRRALGN